MTNQKLTNAIATAFNDAANEAWAETIAELTPEQLEAAKRITPAQWVKAIVEVGLEIGAGFAQMLRKN
jgi:hypothetical protein